MAREVELEFKAKRKVRLHDIDYEKVAKVIEKFGTFTMNDCEKCVKAGAISSAREMETCLACYELEEEMSNEPYTSDGEFKINFVKADYD